MEEQSFHEKEGQVDGPNAQQRLSESRLKFKPVLVKKLLADESDDDDSDDSDNNDNGASNTDDSDDELDNIDGCQPLPDETCTPGELVAKTEIEMSAKSTMTLAITENVELTREADVDASAAIERRSDSNLLSKDPSLAINEEKLASGSKRKSSRGLAELESAAAAQWQLQTTLDKRKSLPVQNQTEPSVKAKYSPDSKRHSRGMAVNAVSETKDRTDPQQFDTFIDSKKIQEPKRYSSASSIGSDEKITARPKMAADQASSAKNSAAPVTLNTTHGVTDTPVKHLQGSTRPNPCTSHRNIFQTPQNKSGSELSKNPLQTPATIFSHWSQTHMAQTPMQNHVPVSRESLQTPATREGMHTPATTCVQSQNTRVERPRYYSVEGKSVRRPLAETMFSAPAPGSQLPRLQEAPNESQPNPPVAKESVKSAAIQDNVGEKKPSYGSSHATYETKENKNPNQDPLPMGESQAGYQPIPPRRNSFNSQPDVKPKLEYHGGAYPNGSNSQMSRAHDNYENYKAGRESQGAHLPHPKQPEQLPPVQYAIPQQTNVYNNNSRQKIITVKGQPYLVLSVIGQGMSCEVVRAQDLANSDLRAIKCVNLNKMDKESVQGCLQEICMLDKLKAPCVVHMYNFEVKQPWVHVVMEIGDTDLSRLLKSMLAEKKKIPLTMILYYWTEMLTAVKHIHDNGVIHSDLKPANFLLVRGRLKLIDFGIASSINADMTSVLKNNAIGTLNYVSPEALLDINAGSNSPNQNVKYKISYKSDVWSLGCILYSLVYGVTPFNHIRQQWGKISAITDPKHKINFPLTIGNEPVPLILVDVMRKCLQHEQKARPSVADLLQIPYLQGNISPPIVPNIPSNILIKIKNALSDEEWKQFSETFPSR